MGAIVAICDEPQDPKEDNDTVDPLMDTNNNGRWREPVRTKSIFESGDEDYSSSEDRAPRTVTQQVRDESFMMGFHNAVDAGNDGLVLWYLDEHSDLDFLSIRFENGDDCLHRAVRNQHYQLLFELLELGVSVE